MSCNRRSIKRKKAIFGEAAAATIQAAATLAAAGLQTAATAKAAKEQAKSIKEQATTQAEALRLQNENANTLQQKSQDFISAENEKQLDYQKTAQMNMLMAMGAEQTADRQRESMIQVRNGGRKSLRVPLRAYQFSTGGNLGFTVTDGGHTNFLGTTNQGNSLYEVKGATHNQHHGNKTGVGFRFSDGSVIEAEGNNGTSDTNGELMYTTPTDAVFLSRHNIEGFNPADAVLYGGMEPERAASIQEYLKLRNPRKYGLSGKAAFGGLNDSTMPSSLSFIMPYQYDNNELMMQGNKMSFGGRKQADFGDWIKKTYNNIKDRWNSRTPTQKSLITGNAITAGANLLGAGINTIGNNIAARRLSRANYDASKIMSDAYNNLKGIDIDSIDWSSYDAPDVFAYTRHGRYNTNPELALLERSQLRNENNIRNNTLGSAAAQTKSNTLGINYNDLKSQIFGKASQYHEGVEQQNTQMINSALQQKAQLQAQASQAKANAKLSLMQYTNGIKNQKILGSAGALSEGISNIGQIESNRVLGNVNNWSGFLTGTGTNITNSIDSYNNYRRNGLMTLMNADNTVFNKLSEQGLLDDFIKRKNNKFGSRLSIKRI